MILHLVRTRGLIVSTYGAVIVYLSGSPQELYEEILNHIMSLAPALKQVNTVFTNETIAPAVRAVLLSVVTRILWLDFVRYVSDLWVRSGLGNAPIEILQYSWTLDLCTEEKYKDGLEFIASKVAEQIPEFPQLAIFFHFFKEGNVPKEQIAPSPVQ
ncbi:uncharacterized protein LOC107037478 [Diachasma alloeum]|uniref:uncharacterized protein LOC107037478 n=1 Tax=Diachasma alloeum TaxID=454923 RepID=UPI0007385004|nr:uncharacterized protein LOC107037478 [Diachasma alloeum]